MKGKVYCASEENEWTYITFTDGTQIREPIHSRPFPKEGQTIFYNKGDAI